MKWFLFGVVLPGFMLLQASLSWAVDEVNPLATASGVPGTVACSACAMHNVAVPDWVQIMVFALVVGFLLVSLLAVKRSLKDGGWSLAHALSEDIEPTQGVGDAGAVIPANGQVLAGGTVMVGSASRLIAFMGMLVILAFFIGVGLWLLWELLSTGCVPGELDKLTSYFYGGAMLFAPYMANQFKAALSAIVK